MLLQRLIKHKSKVQNELIKEMHVAGTFAGLEDKMFESLDY